MAEALLPPPIVAIAAPPPRARRCATLLTFLQFALGVLLPLLCIGLGEARLFQLHQRQRWDAQLPLERGWRAAAYDWVWWASLGASGPHTALLCCLGLPFVWFFASVAHLGAPA